MSTEETTEDPTVETEHDTELVRQLRAQLREEKQGRVTVEQELAAKSKQEVFRGLGIDIDTGPGKLLFEHYQGEVDPEAVKTAAETYSVPVGATGQPPAEGTPPEGAAPPANHPDAEAHAELSKVRDQAAGAATPTANQKATEAYNEAVAAGRPTEEAMATWFSQRFNDAVAERSRGGS